MTESCDALIIGGGPGGATAALLLARAGWSVILLERKCFPRRKVCGEYLSGTNRALLEQLGVAEAFDNLAGPQVRRVGLFAGNTLLHADLPSPGCWGRALARQQLDTLLLQRAAAAGVSVWQPFTAMNLSREGPSYHCRAVGSTPPEVRTVRTPVVIAAHGSWDAGPLPTQGRRPPPRSDDLFGFKAHFRHSSLPDDLMPLLAFPGGYGGMVRCDEGRVSLSCCVRRDQLKRIRQRWPGQAGPAVLEHIRASCRGVRQVLTDAQRDGPWLTAGPIRPGIRLRPTDGIFRVGNAAGEAHPVIAEGISMAMQGAWLLTERLLAKRGGTLAEVAVDYGRAWLRNFGPRLRTAAVVAHWAMRPLAVVGLLPLLRQWPTLLTWGASLAGKAQSLRLGPADR